LLTEVRSDPATRQALRGAQAVLLGIGGDGAPGRGHRRHLGRPAVFLEKGVYVEWRVDHGAKATQGRDSPLHTALRGADQLIRWAKFTMNPSGPRTDAMRQMPSY